MILFSILIILIPFMLLNLYIFNLKTFKFPKFTITITKSKIKDVDALYKIIENQSPYNHNYSIVKHQYMTKIYNVKTLPINDLIRNLLYMIPFIFLVNIKYTGYIKRSHKINFDTSNFRNYKK